jgi:hypothetical protein
MLPEIPARKNFRATKKMFAPMAINKAFSFLPIKVSSDIRSVNHFLKANHTHEKRYKNISSLMKSIAEIYELNWGGLKGDKMSSLGEKALSIRRNKPMRGKTERTNNPIPI